MTNKQKLRNKADKLWFQKGMEGFADDFGGVACEICGDKATQGHHFFRKSSHPILRYSFENFIPLCVKCHSKITFQDPKIMEDIIIKNRGRKWYNKLLKKAKEKPKSGYLTIKYYEDIIKKLNEHLY